MKANALILAIAVRISASGALAVDARANTGDDPDRVIREFLHGGGDHPITYDEFVKSVPATASRRVAQTRAPRRRRRKAPSVPPAERVQPICSTLRRVACKV